MGDCNKCGRCCTQLTFTLKGLSNNRIFLDYYKKHGCKHVGDMLIVPMRCPHLDDNNKCNIYDKRPLLCKTFKGQSSSSKVNYYVPEGCGYGRS